MLRYFKYFVEDNWFLILLFFVLIFYIVLLSLNLYFDFSYIKSVDLEVDGIVYENVDYKIGYDFNEIIIRNKEDGTKTVVVYDYYIVSNKE